MAIYLAEEFAKVFTNHISYMGAVDMARPYDDDLINLFLSIPPTFEDSLFRRRVSVRALLEQRLCLPRIAHISTTSGLFRLGDGATMKATILPVDLFWDEDGQPRCTDLIAFNKRGHWQYSRQARWLNAGAVEDAIVAFNGTLNVAISALDWFRRSWRIQSAGESIYDCPVFPLNTLALRDLFELAPDCQVVALGGRAHAVALRETLKRESVRMPQIAVLGT